MLKIIHVLVGVIALLLSFVPSLNGALPLLVQPDALCLLLLGLMNAQFASAADSQNDRGRPLLLGASALLIGAAALQMLVVLAPVITLAGQPATLASLMLAFVAVVLQLAIVPAKKAAPANRNPAMRPRKNPSSQTSGASSAEREMGTVKWFNTSKGFGFISRDSGDDVFVHFRAIRGEGHRVLTEGQRVEFSIMMRDKGLQAEDVVAAQPDR